jgi:hypothetical protein
LNAKIGNSNYVDRHKATAVTRKICRLIQLPRSNHEFKGKHLSTLYKFINSVCNSTFKKGLFTYCGLLSLNHFFQWWKHVIFLASVFDSWFLKLKCFRWKLHNDDILSMSRLLILNTRIHAIYYIIETIIKNLFI